MLAYAETINLAESSARSGAHTTFSLNGLYDPNTGAIGSQPVGFDQMMAMYGQYRVWRVRVNCTFQNANTTAANPVQCVIYGTYQPAVPSNPAAWFCQPFGRTAVIEPVGGRSGCILKCSFDIPKVLGLTRAQYTSDMDFVGTSGGNPTRQAYLVVGQQSNFVATGYCTVFVQIAYEVEFSQPLALNLS